MSTSTAIWTAATTKRSADTHTDTNCSPILVAACVVNDPGMDWGAAVGRVQVVLSAVGFVYAFADAGLRQPTLECSGSAPHPTTPNLYSKDHGEAYCEVSYESYLANWHAFRAAHFADADNAHLFSYLDFAACALRSRAAASTR